ncbi:MAG TPA: HEAT repeat domain-containing protein, partial [Nitrospirota bacterium]
MKPFIAALTCIFILSGPDAVIAEAPAANPVISLAPVPALRFNYDSQRSDILPLYISGLRASFSLEKKSKAKVELTWLMPSGEQAQKTVKLAFPDKTGRTVVWDSIQFNAGQAAGPAAGWWIFEAHFEGKKLSRRFLLTDSRQILTLASGDKRDRLEAVMSLDPAVPNIAEVVSIAFEDADAEVREAALRAAAASSTAKARNREVLVRGTKDPSEAVRADAFGYLVGMGGAEGIKDAEDAAKDPSPIVRSKAAMASPISDPAVEAVLAGLIKDSEPEVREL